MLKKTLIALLLALGASTIVSAETNTTIMVTDSGTEIALDDVDFLLGSDTDDTFSIILRKSNTIIDNVNSVSFKKASGIFETNYNNKPEVVACRASKTIYISNLAANTTLTITSLSGVTINSFTSDGTDMQISVSDLPCGCYILNTGTSSVKFIKQ